MYYLGTIFSGGSIRTLCLQLHNVDVVLDTELMVMDLFSATVWMLF